MLVFVQSTGGGSSCLEKQSTRYHMIARSSPTRTSTTIPLSLSIIEHQDRRQRLAESVERDPVPSPAMTTTPMPHRAMSEPKVHSMRGACVSGNPLASNLGRSRRDLSSLNLCRAHKRTAGSRIVLPASETRTQSASPGGLCWYEQFARFISVLRPLDLTPVLCHYRREPFL